MSYSTDQDIYGSIGQDTVRRLTDDDQTGSVDEEMLDRQRQKANEKVNTYLQSRYELPLDSPPDILAQIETALLARRLYRRRPNADTPEDVEDGADEAMKMLREIAKGLITLGIDEDGDGEEDGAPSYRSKTPDERELTRRLDTYY